MRDLIHQSRKDILGDTWFSVEAAKQLEYNSQMKHRKSMNQVASKGRQKNEHG